MPIPTEDLESRINVYKQTQIDWQWWHYLIFVVSGAATLLVVVFFGLVGGVIAFVPFQIENVGLILFASLLYGVPAFLPILALLYWRHSKRSKVAGLTCDDCGANFYTREGKSKILNGRCPRCSVAIVTRSSNALDELWRMRLLEPAEPQTLMDKISAFTPLVLALGIMYEVFTADSSVAPDVKHDIRMHPILYFTTALALIAVFLNSYPWAEKPPHLGGSTGDRIKVSFWRVWRMFWRGFWEACGDSFASLCGKLISWVFKHPVLFVIALFFLHRYLRMNGIIK
ncbi:MAG: hypothetical protein IPK22_17590 [Verrucomicrobiaceae bacterium]|nr:hypothetical protein [Verrucomicrobiaceae bacterium]